MGKHHLTKKHASSFSGGALKSVMLTAFLLFLLLSVALTAGGGVSPSEGGIQGIDYKDGLLKVSAEEEKLQKIITDIAEKTGIKVVFISPVDDVITVSFDYLPLEEGLQKLLSGKSHVFFYSGEAGLQSKLSQVLILPGSGKDGESVSKNIMINGSSDNTGQTGEGRNRSILDREKLDAMLKGFSINNEEIREQFYKALEDIRKTDGFKDIMQTEEEILKQTEEVKKALENIPDIEKKIMQTQKEVLH